MRMLWRLPCRTEAFMKASISQSGSTCISFSRRRSSPISSAPAKVHHAMQLKSFRELPQE